jgi:adenylate kinase family enzyme
MTTPPSPKLIIIRGNSGSGKSTVAKKLRETSQRKIALVEQDNIRRIILKEKEVDGGANIDLIAQTVEFALERGYDVILEGILNFSRYGKMLERLRSLCSDTHVYYFDISIEETLRRHATKSCADEFGEKELRAWYKYRDLTHFQGEVLVTEEPSLDQTVEKIIRETGL